MPNSEEEKEIEAAKSTIERLIKNAADLENSASDDLCKKMSNQVKFINVFLNVKEIEEKVLDNYNRIINLVSDAGRTTQRELTQEEINLVDGLVESLLRIVRGDALSFKNSTSSITATNNDKLCKKIFNQINRLELLLENERIKEIYPKIDGAFHDVNSLVSSGISKIESFAKRALTKEEMNLRDLLKDIFFKEEQETEDKLYGGEEISDQELQETGSKILSSSKPIKPFSVRFRFDTPVTATDDGKNKEPTTRPRAVTTADKEPITHPRGSKT